jgi:SanA protein
MKPRNKFLLVLAGAVAAAVLACVLINVYVSTSTAVQIKPVAALTPAQGVLLLGARVYPNGRVSPIVQDRIATALAVYRAGMAHKILVSGDHGTRYYDEVNTIKKKLLEAGVPEEDIFLDHAGFNTYDSVYRARDVFAASSLVIVTQAFHLDRALYTANQLGVPAQGVAADRRRYRDARWYAVREFAANVVMFFKAAIFKPRPKFLGPVIPLAGSGLATRD